MPKKADAVKGEPAKTEIVNVSLRLDPALHDRLRKMAFDKRRQMHPIIVEAIEAFLKAAKY
jgi:predicted transcriptional regulator